MSTNKAIKQLVKATQTSSGEAKKEYMEQLLLIMQPLRFNLGKRYANKGIEFDDLSQMIDLSLIEAIENYDETLDSSILRHMKNYTKNRVWNYYRKEMNYFKKGRTALSLEVVDENGNSLISDFEEDEIINRIVLEAELGRLSQREQDILNLYVLEDNSEYQIAEKIGIHQSNVSRNKKRAIEKMRGKLKD